MTDDLLDQETVAQLRDTVGSGMLPIITDWAAELDEKLMQIAEAVDASDRDQIAQLAHPFASSSLQLGAQKLGETMRELEFTALAIEGHTWSQDTAADLLGECCKLAPASGQALREKFDKP